ALVRLRSLHSLSFSLTAHPHPHIHTLSLHDALPILQVRTQRISGLRAILGICIFLFAFFPATRVSAQCAPPHYQEGQIWENSESTVLTAISIHLTDFAPPKLICLANALKQRYGDRKRTTVLIFSSADAAKRYLLYQQDYAPANGPKQERLQSRQFWVSHLHALYSY